MSWSDQLGHSVSHSFKLAKLRGLRVYSLCLSVEKLQNKSGFLLLCDSSQCFEEDGKETVEQEWNESSAKIVGRERNKVEKHKVSVIK